MSTLTPADVANVIKLLERLRTGEMNLIPAMDTDEPRDPDSKSVAMLQRVESLLSAHLRLMQEPIGDGGPAFPRDHAHDGHNGMTLRDYFIAHAPAEPQPWFAPAMPHPEPVMPPYPELTEVEKQEHREYNAGDCDIEEISSPSLAGYLRSLVFYERQLADWREDFNRQRYIQWPAAWADAMLRARSGS